MNKKFLSWVQFGDLHIRDAQDENYLDLLQLVEEVNTHLAGKLDFVFLPGDNADDGTDPQYCLVKQALQRLKLPVHAIAGDHDRKNGTLDLFKHYLEPRPYRAITLNNFRLLFLNAMDASDPKTFDLSHDQMSWLRHQLAEAQDGKLRPLVFTHLYPSELQTQGPTVSRLFREFGVELVEMGHTHYNELANDGQIIYAATRSTGQIEEGPPGFSLTTVDGDVVSWKFKERGACPFVVITSPADEKLITRPRSIQHIVRGQIPIRASLWGNSGAARVTCAFNDATPEPMHYVEGHWQYLWNSSHVPDGICSITVTAETPAGQAQDQIAILVNQSGHYTSPERSTIDYENTIGAYPAKSIFGTQLGPNENGSKGPWPSWSNR